jgi:tetratricopeptide (TPR) repeat protein
MCALRTLPWPRAEAIRIAPNAIEPRLSLAEVYLQSKAFDHAIQEGQTVLRLQPDHIGTQLIVGRAYLDKGELPNAVAAFKTVTANTPQDLSGYYYLGLAYRQQQNEPEALAAFEKALVFNSNLNDALAQIATTYIARGEESYRTCPHTITDILARHSILSLLLKTRVAGEQLCQLWVQLPQLLDRLAGATEQIPLQ